MATSQSSGFVDTWSERLRMMYRTTTSPSEAIHDPGQGSQSSRALVVHPKRYADDGEERRRDEPAQERQQPYGAWSSDCGLRPAHQDKRSFS